jgi:hypothetical protein
MFGSSLKSKTKNVLKKDFYYAPIHAVQKPALSGIVQQAKSQNLNEYDAAIMFMLVQMNALSPSDSRAAGFITEQGQNIENVMSLAASPRSEILHMLNEIKSKHSSNFEGDDEISKLVEIITNSLTIQKGVFAANDAVLPKKAKDKWTLGYIGGYSDALLQSAGVATDTKGFAIMTIVFMNILGKKKAQFILENSWTFSK